MIGVQYYLNIFQYFFSYQRIPINLERIRMQWVKLPNEMFLGYEYDTRLGSNRIKNGLIGSMEGS